MIRTPVLLLLAALVAGCATVAADAPSLLSRDEIVARTAGAADSARGQQAADTLAWRAASLRARAAALRRTGIQDGERLELMRRAEELKAQNR